MEGLFGRKRPDGNIQMFENCGEVATRLKTWVLYPVGGGVSTHYEHPEGIIITPEDASKIKLFIEE